MATEDLLTDGSLTIPIVSVVMPVFNSEQTVFAALNSILSQSFTNIEVLVGDDGSTDTTFERMNLLDDPRLKLFRFAENVGAGATRDQLIASAQGSWIAFCDADDKWEPKRLSALLEVVGADLNAIAFDDMMQYHSTAQGMRPWRRMRGAHAFGASGKPVHISTRQLIDSPRMLIQPIFSTALLRKSGAVHSAHPYGEDSAFLLRLLAHGGKLIYVPKALYLYRLTPGSASSHPERQTMLGEILQNAMADFSEQPEVQAALAKKIARIRREALYAPLVESIKRRQIRPALHLVVNHPWMLGMLLWRTLLGAPYHLHRLYHGGATRGSK